MRNSEKKNMCSYTDTTQDFDDKCSDIQFTYQQMQNQNHPTSSKNASNEISTLNKFHLRS